MKKLFIILALIGGIFFSHKTAQAYGECMQYGTFSTYDSFSNSCKCMSGYSFSDNYAGQPYCVSDTQMCTDQYGYHATSDYLTGNCKCNSGYAFGKNSIGKTQCISLNSMCQDQLGYNSSYNSLYDQCQCGYGYIIKNNQCVNADNYCTSEQGLYSSYNSASKTCACDSGYTLSSGGKCEKKQNNVYFYLKELDVDTKTAIIKSDYDSTTYLIKYNSGCYNLPFKRYLRSNIVVNLGTDYYLDTWDKIVLQDDNETCDVVSKQQVDSSYSLIKVGSVDNNFTYVGIPAQNKTIYTAPKTATPSSVIPVPKTVAINETDITKKTEPKEILIPEEAKTSVIDVGNQIEPILVKKIKWYQKILNWFKRK